MTRFHAGRLIKPEIEIVEVCIPKDIPRRIFGCPEACGFLTAIDEAEIITAYSVVTG